MSKILIVEDTERHLKDALNAVEDYPRKIYEVDTASTLQQARLKMLKHKYRRVILDFFFPLNDTNYINNNQIPSALLFIPEFIGKAKIVVCTDIYHHAESFHIYNHIMINEYPTIPIVDLYKPEPNAPKNWSGALDLIFK